MPSLSSVFLRIIVPAMMAGFVIGYFFALGPMIAVAILGFIAIIYFWNHPYGLGVYVGVGVISLCTGMIIMAMSVNTIPIARFPLPHVNVNKSWFFRQR